MKYDRLDGEILDGCANKGMYATLCIKHRTQNLIRADFGTGSRSQTDNRLKRLDNRTWAGIVDFNISDNHHK